jgi:hypothetical protein
MSQPKCSCEKFERLEGASVNAYASTFLKDLGRAAASHKDRYRCRVCGREWEKRPPDEAHARPSLVRISEQ